MGKLKEEARNLIDKLPENATLDDLMYELYINQKIQNGLDAINNGDVIDSAFLMDYHTFDFSLGLSTGYTFHTPIGRFGTGTGIRSSLSYVTYDSGINRPYSNELRENFERWMATHKWWTSLSWDTRDIVHSPTTGFYLNESFSYVGGIFTGQYHYMKSTTKGEIFQQLFEVPFDDIWTFKLVAAAHTSFSMVLPQFHYSTDNETWEWEQNAGRGDLLFNDGMSIMRGWSRLYDMEAMWDNWIELRMPIIEDYLWMDLFASATGLWDNLSDVGAPGLEDYYFSMGAGLRLTIPGLPIGVFLTKPFKYDQSGAVEWQMGDLFTDPDATENTFTSTGLKFVITFSSNFF